MMERSVLERINNVHIQYLEPLSKWRILSIEDLLSEAHYRLHPSGLQKIIKRLENVGIVKGYRDPWSKKKYVYLSEIGRQFFNVSDNSVCEETMVHDAWVTRISRSFLKWKSIKDVELEHEFNTTSDFIPDAILFGKKKGRDFKIAFELEITRKSKSRIFDKISHYLSSSFYDYILYMFTNESVYIGYKKYLWEQFGEAVSGRVILARNKSILSKKLDINQSLGVFKNEEVHLKSIFN